MQKKRHETCYASAIIFFVCHLMLLQIVWNINSNMVKFTITGVKYVK